MAEEKTEIQIRDTIKELVSDGSQDQINKLAHLLQERDADSSFLQGLFSRLSCNKTKLFRETCS